MEIYSPSPTLSNRLAPDQRSEAERPEHCEGPVFYSAGSFFRKKPQLNFPE
jgi:hypothetical protein